MPSFTFREGKKGDVSISTPLGCVLELVPVGMQHNYQEEQNQMGQQLFTLLGGCGLLKKQYVAGPGLMVSFQTQFP